MATLLCSAVRRVWAWVALKCFRHVNSEPDGCASGSHHAPCTLSAGWHHTTRGRLTSQTHNAHIFRYKARYKARYTAELRKLRYSRSSTVLRTQTSFLLSLCLGWIFAPQALTFEPDRLPQVSVVAPGTKLSSWTGDLLVVGVTEEDLATEGE